MEPSGIRAGFGETVNQSIVNPVVLLIVLVLGVLICFGSRKRAIAAFLGGAIMIPMDQILMIGPLHFPMLRLLLLFGMVRMFRTKISSQLRILGTGWNNIDIALVALTIISAINGIALYRDSTTVVYELGELYTAFGGYVLLRYLIRDEDDVRVTIRALAWIAVMVAGVMIYEQATGRNPIYGFLGGARADVFGSVLEREGRRATGPFGHPILAGTFGAITLPLFVGLWWDDRKYRTTALAGISAAAIIPFAANSSTALMGFIGGLIALGFWYARRQMRIVRWAFVLSVIVLHSVMKAPVWHLISRIDLSGGSSSYHRYQLVNQCIQHFSDWWLIGTKYYGDWGWDMWDLSDQYVLIADESGLIALLCFLAMIVYGFKYLGRARRLSINHRQELFIWAIGSSLFANVIAFLGIGYFDQTIIVWYALMAVIAVVTLGERRTQVLPQEKASEAETSFSFEPDLEPELKMLR